MRLIKVFGHFLPFSLIIISGLFLAGCPNAMVQQVEKSIAMDSTIRATRLKLYREMRTLTTNDYKKEIEKRNQLLAKNKAAVYDSVNGTYVYPDSSRKSSINTNQAQPQLILPQTSFGTNSKPNQQIILAAEPEEEAAKRSVYIDFKKLIHKTYPDSIEFRFTVSDEEIGSIAGLAPPFYKEKDYRQKYWIRLTDSCKGNTTKIDNFQISEIRSSSSTPHAIAFVLDHSGSMGNERCTKLQEAVKEVTKYIKRNDQVSIIKFADKTVTEIPLTSDKSQYSNILIEGMGGTKYGGGTSIYPSLLQATSELSKADSSLERVIILFTDGYDGQHNVSLDSAIRIAKANKVSIYSIGYGLNDPEVLDKISRLTGGRSYQIRSSKEMLYVFKAIYTSLNNYYRVVYTPPVCEGKHHVRIDLNIPEVDLYGLSGAFYYDKSMISQDAMVGDISFADIVFDYGKSDILPESMPIIERIAASLKENQNIKLEISGHTDDAGSEEFNKQLSLARAKSVKMKLVSMGIDESRFLIKGFGETMPLVPNDSDENRRKNRRTEFKITSN